MHKLATRSYAFTSSPFFNFVHASVCVEVLAETLGRRRRDPPVDYKQPEIPARARLPAHPGPAETARSGATFKRRRSRDSLSLTRTHYDNGKPPDAPPSTT